MPNKLNFSNPKTQEASNLHLLANLNQIAQEDYETLEEIFNQPEIYKIFGRGLDGKRIEEDRIKSILSFYVKGFEGKTCYLYLIRNSKEKIIGGIDLQIETTISLSIGFWCDEKEKGFISGGIRCLKEILSKEGIKEINSYTEPQNINAIKVLERNEFEFVGETSGKSGNRLLKYLLRLN